MTGISNMPLIVDVVTEDDIRNYVQGRLESDRSALVAQAIRSDPKAARIWRTACFGTTAATDRRTASKRLHRLNGEN